MPKNSHNSGLDAAACIRRAHGAAWFFGRKPLKALWRVSTAERRIPARRGPYPHAVFDGFLGEARALELAQRFPGPEHAAWLRRDYCEQSARLGQLQRAGFEGVDPALRHLLAELSSLSFLDFLGALSGVEGLIPDPHFRGAGLSLTLPSGHLALHADFNRDRTRHLAACKLTVIYYLGQDWQPGWGGALELWDEARTRCEASYLPILDRLIVMDHGDTFWHGHPQPLACPPEEPLFARRSPRTLPLRRDAQPAMQKNTRTARFGRSDATPFFATPLRLPVSHLQRYPAQTVGYAAPGAALAEQSVMNISLTGLLVLLIIAGVCGGIGRALSGGGTAGGGFFVSIAVGFVGALLGSFVAHYFHLPELLMVNVDGHAFPILWSIIGAALFVALIHLVSGGSPRRSWRY